jgi:hypothetical protein
MCYLKIIKAPWDARPCSHHKTSTWPITDPNSKLVLHHYALLESTNCPSFPFKVNTVFMKILAGYIDRIMETRNAYRILVKNFPEKCPLKD